MGDEEKAEKLQPASAQDEPKETKSSWVGMHNRHWSAFFFGPFFKIIPSTVESNQKHARKAKEFVKERKKAEEKKAEQDLDESIDYLSALKRIILDEVDTDGTYGLVNDELVPLPFDTPKMWEYVVDFLAGTYLVAQATIVMFIGIMVDNDQRGYLLGSSYSNQWLPIIKALVILYPLITLITMTMLTCEYLFRKYMYYRMLSMRVLVDWENKVLWQGLFFWYFVGTWVLLNVWCLYGVIRFWAEGASSGADTVQFTTWIVVNLQTMQLLLYYYRLITSELRLVSLNQIFERAPVEAQMLITYTYIVEESVLIDECRAFGHQTVDSLRLRVLYVLTCGKFGRSWRQKASHAKFDLNRVKARADNYEQVEEAVLKLRDELLAEAGDSSTHRVDPKLAATTAEKPVAPGQVVLSMEPANNGSTYPPTLPPPGPLFPTLPPASTALQAPATAGNGAGSGAGAYPTIGAAEGLLVAPGNTPGSGITALPAPGAIAATRDTSSSSGGGAKAGDHTPVTPVANREGNIAFLEEKDSSLNFLQRFERNFQRSLYHRFYGSIHGLYCAFLVHFPTWPFRGDIPYFRALCVLELCGVMSVGAIVVFGILRTASTSRCSQGDRGCQQCLDFTQQWNDTCPINYNITRMFFPPPPGQLG